MSAAQTKSAPRSLKDFAAAERRKGCKVCALPDSVRSEIVKASERKINRRTVLAWLNDELKLGVTNDALTAHTNARHELR